MAQNQNDRMSKFGGFPAGEPNFISIPEQFFSELLPEIDSLAELKVALYMLWLRQKRKKLAVYETELLADETLLRSFSAADNEPQAAIQDGLRRAAGRGSLLLLEMPGRGRLYLLNSESGRLLLEQLTAGEADIPAPAPEKRKVEKAAGGIFQLYEANIGLLSPILAEELQEAEDTYPPAWIEEAFKLAVENNARKWAYIRAILKRWAVDGKDNGITKKSRKDDRKWFTDEEYEQFVQH